MKAFKRKLSMLLAISAMAFGVGLKSGDTTVVKAADSTSTDTITVKGFGNYTSNSFSAAGTDYTGTGSLNTVTYAMQVFNGSSGAVRGNKNANNNFSFRNTTVLESHYIKSISLTVTGGTLDGSTDGRSLVYFGETAFSNPTTAPTGTGKNSKENKSGQATLTWENTDTTSSYFILYNLKTSGTATSGSLVVTYAKSNVSDDELIQAVEDAITAIGIVEYSDACKAKIDDARSEYNALDDLLKASVTNYNTLVEAETTYENLKNEALEKIDKDAAQTVVDLINSLPSADSITDYSANNDYVAAKEAYDSLTETQKGYVGSEYVTKLNAVGEKLQEYKPLVYEIDMDGTLNSSPSKISSLDKFEAAYITPDGISWAGTLTNVYGSKGEVFKIGTSSNPGSFGLVLDDSDYYITKIEVSAKYYNSKDGAAIKVTVNDNDLEGNSLTENKAIYSFDVSEYEASSIVIGTTVKRAYIFGINVYYAEHIVDVDQTKVDAVIALINSIGTVEPTLDVKNKIESAELAYNNLKPAEQELVTNYLTLTSARTSFNEYVLQGNEVDGIAVGYKETTFTCAELKIDANMAGNYSSIGYNAKNYENAKATQNIADALGIEASTQGVVTLHSYFYNGFISLSLLAQDSLNGTYSVLTSSDGGITYTEISNIELSVTSGSEFKIEYSSANITDIVIVFVMGNEAQRMSISSLTYYSNANAEDAETLIELIAGLDTCTDYNQAEICREFYNELSDYEKIIFNRATIIDNEKDTNKEVSVNVLDKLMYMEYLNTENAKSTESSLNLFISNNSNNMTLILIVGLLGLSAVAAYYFLNKKKYSC